MFLDFDFKINLDVSKAVTKEEWADVYNESLKLIEVFPLAKWEEKTIDSIKTPCISRLLFLQKLPLSAIIVFYATRNDYLRQPRGALERPL